MMQRAAQEGQFTAHPEQYYTHGIAFWSHNSVQFGSPLDVEGPTQGSEQEEMLKKIEKHRATHEKYARNTRVQKCCV